MQLSEMEQTINNSLTHFAMCYWKSRANHSEEILSLHAAQPFSCSHLHVKSVFILLSVAKCC